MAVKSTRLRFVSSKDATKLVEFVDGLPFKIEIKGAPVLKQDTFYLFFVIPDSQETFNSINLD